MGDGLLAIFPLAGRDAQGRFAARRSERRVRCAAPSPRSTAGPSIGRGEAPRHGLALHIGELLYGNIGAANRLDFTCIGPAVNLAARLEALARASAAPRWCRRRSPPLRRGLAPLGEFAFAGFRAPASLRPRRRDRWSG